MNEWPLSARLIEEFAAMSGQLQCAARFILDRPHDVALLSMREQARCAGVMPATMTRLAKHLGLDGYEPIRRLYADAMRDGTLDLPRQAKRQVDSQQRIGPQALAESLVKSLAGQLRHLAGPAGLESFAAATETLAAARRIYCLGLRSSFAPAAHFHYILSLAREGMVLCDAAGGIGLDALGNVTGDDAVLVVSVHPYTRRTVEAANYAAARGAGLVAITDSPVSPLAQAARQMILVETSSSAFLHTLTPAFAAAEILAALVAGRCGTKTLAVLQETGKLLAALNVHMNGPLGKQT